MRKIFAGLGILSLILALALPIWATETAGVSATVTPRLLSVSVSPTSVGYGTVDVPSVDKAPVTPSTDPVITATNNGNDTEKLNIKGDNATGDTITWNITTGSPSGAGGTPVYGYNHKFGKGPDYPTFTAMDTSYATLVASVAKDGTQAFKLKLSTPTETGGDYSLHSTTVTVQAVAP